MPVCVAQIVRKGTVRGATVRHHGDLVSAVCHRIPLAAQPPATCAWKSPRATRWWVRWSVGTGWWLAAAGPLPRLLSCRVRELVARRVLSRPGACRSPDLAGTQGVPRQVSWLVFPASSSCRGLCASSGLLGKLLLPGPCALSGLPGKLL